MVERSSENRIFRFSDDLFISLTDTELVFCFGGEKEGFGIYGVQFSSDCFHKGINDGL
ncbi:hypothetical protein HMPREF1051_0319 [Neisseria sicca VK64]|uniref:Uncharacterized protein n=1 Tax=Neisseria sicca VK64 TaxID=1095748 RepID=I2NJR3_NEISI|nr:hypothetical protein HMPREF1051_0319 [Neisseria sicca VK64]